MSSEIKLSEEDFMIIMNLLDGAYQSFKLSENVLKSWYFFLKRYENKEAWGAISYWIRNNKYPPSINELLELLD